MLHIQRCADRKLPWHHLLNKHCEHIFVTMVRLVKGSQERKRKRVHTMLNLVSDRSEYRLSAPVSAYKTQSQGVIILTKKEPKVRGLLRVVIRFHCRMALWDVTERTQSSTSLESHQTSLPSPFTILCSSLP